MEDVEADREIRDTNVARSCQPDVLEGFRYSSELVRRAVIPTAVAPFAPVFVSSLAIFPHIGH